MDYKNIRNSFSEKSIDEYLNFSVNKIFAILGIYEDCVKADNLENYYTYLTRIITELSGFSSIFENSFFVSVISVLVGMLEDKNPTHKKVKSLTFHCISLLKKSSK